MSRPRLRHAAVATLSAVALLLPLGAAASPAQAAQGVQPSSTTTRNAGPWTVLEGQDGSTVLYDDADSSLHGDARPEFVLDGRTLGPATGGVNGSPLRLVLPGARGIDAARLSISTDEPISAPRPTTEGEPTGRTPAQPRTLVSPDPGRAGAYRTTAFGYRGPGLSIDGLKAPVEVLGQVVAPVGASGPRPVVLFLHGRHSTCFAGDEVTIDWPCAPGSTPIPSLQGYRQTQALLASRGYVTVSIAANGINGQDGELVDSGAHARSVLVRHHLALLAAWSRVAGPGATAALKGRLDLQRVMLVGHSRGGEGVARAAIEATSAEPFRIAGQLLIAPTDFGRQVAVGIPTTVLLPYCDGDVSDLQGQQFVDQARGLATGDRALVTSAMVFGANHNFFNSEWTPGVATAPAEDDWTDDTDATCAADATGRLRPAEQRAVGATYAAAAADSYLSRSTTAVALLDGRAVRAASAGRAVVLTQALGSTRRALLTGTPSPAVATTRGMTATPCLGFVKDTGDGGGNGGGQPVPIEGAAPRAAVRAAAVEPQVGEACQDEQGSASPHWLPGDLDAPYALRLQWSAARSTAVVRLPAPVDGSTSSFVETRVIADPSVATSGLALVLVDAAGRSRAVSAGSLAPLPGTDTSRKLWAGTLRVPLSAFTGVDRSRIRAIGLRGTTREGLVYVLDAFVANRGQVPSAVTPRSVARFDVTTPEVTLPADDQVHPVQVPVRITGPVTRPARLRLVTQSEGGNPVATDVVVPVGQTSLTVTVPVTSSSVWSPEPDLVVVGAYALRDAVIGGYVGGAEVGNGVAAPTLTVLEPRAEAAQGATLRWTLRLSAPTRFGFTTTAAPVAPVAGTELTTRDALGAWVRDVAEAPLLPDGSPAPLSQAEISLDQGFDQLGTSYTVELPTARTSTATGDREVLWEIAPDGKVLTQPLRFGGTVRPGA